MANEDAQKKKAGDCCSMTSTFAEQLKTEEAELKTLSDVLVVHEENVEEERKAIGEAELPPVATIPIICFSRTFAEDYYDYLLGD